MIPIILSGGSGTRLWPLSRKTYPKQFLNLLHEETMLQKTVSRLKGLKHESPIVVCNEDHRFIVAEQLRQLGIEDATIILEPFGKNTAPAIAVAAIHACEIADNPALLVLSADHEIENEEEFCLTVNQASELVDAESMVTFGIVPTFAATGYGYIQRGQADKSGFTVKQFVEKPDQLKAEEFYNSDDYYWNSGMFMFRADTFLNELTEHKPEIVKHCKNAATNMDIDFGFKRINSEPFDKCESISIDYAVMEKTSRATVIPLDAGWSDIGSWESLWQQANQDENGNAIVGDVITTDTSDCYVHSENRLVTTLGMTNTIVVETSDAVLVANKDSTQEVKQIIEKLASEGRCEEHSHRNIYRPWGCFDSVDEGDRYKVKRITVNPGARLSVQMHHHRAEHWVVVSGTARVYRNDEIHMISENESIFIPLGHKHSLENPGIIPLEIIEIQSGAYLGEDDIVRFEDKYGRGEPVEQA